MASFLRGLKSGLKRLFPGAANPSSSKTRQESASAGQPDGQPEQVIATDKIRLGTRISNRIKRLDAQYGLPIGVPTKRQSIIPVAIVSGLFFMWGFAYGILDTVNAHIKVKMAVRPETAALLATAYYASYIPAAWVVGGRLIRNCGYRVAFTSGLTLFGLGNFFIAIGAYFMNMPGIIAGYFVVGLGVGTLERSANPYVVHCGPSSQSIIRINLAQFFAAVGTIVAPQFCKVMLPADEIERVAKVPAVVDVDGMQKIVMMYLIVGGLGLGLALLFGAVFFGTKKVSELRLYPEGVTDEEIAAPKNYTFWTHPLWKSRYLQLAAFACAFNISCQVTIAQNLMDYCLEVAGVDKKRGADFLTLAQGLFAVGRFVFSGILAQFNVRARKVFLFYITAAIVTTVLIVVGPNKFGIAMVILVMFWEGPLFPTMFDTAISGHGIHTLRAEDVMISCISGGAILPPLFGLMARAQKYRYAFGLVAGFFVPVFCYGVGINVSPTLKHILDVFEVVPRHNPDNGSPSSGDVEMHKIAPLDGLRPSQSEADLSRNSFLDGPGEQTQIVRTMTQHSGLENALQHSQTAPSPRMVERMKKERAGELEAMRRNAPGPVHLRTPE